MMHGEGMSDKHQHFKIKPTAPQALKDLFPGDPIQLIMIDGAMTTIELFNDFDLNPCHLFEDGTIKRFREVIATRDDIEIEGEKP